MIKVDKNFTDEICDYCANPTSVEIDLDDRKVWLCAAHRDELSFDLVLNNLMARLYKRRGELLEQLDQNYTPKSVKAEISISEINNLIAMCKGEI